MVLRISSVLPEMILYSISLRTLSPPVEKIDGYEPRHKSARPRVASSQAPYRSPCRFAVRAHSLCCSSFPTPTRFAGLGAGSHLLYLLSKVQMRAGAGAPALFSAFDVLASSGSFASSQARKLIPSAARPLRRRPASLGSPTALLFRDRAAVPAVSVHDDHGLRRVLAHQPVFHIQPPLFEQLLLLPGRVLSVFHVSPPPASSSISSCSQSSQQSPFQSTHQTLSRCSQSCSSRSGAS